MNSTVHQSLAQKRRSHSEGDHGTVASWYVCDLGITAEMFMGFINDQKNEPVALLISKMKCKKIISSQNEFLNLVYPQGG